MNVLEILPSSMILTKKIHYSFLLICSFLFSISYTFSQKIDLTVDFLGYVDNREFSAPYTIPKTFFGTTISPQFGFHLDENHKLFGGMHFNQEFGINRENKSLVRPIAYYAYTTKNLQFALGFMPRQGRLNDISRMVLADTFRYDRPNVEGMYFDYKNDRFEQTVFIDWLNKQGNQNREQFVAGLKGKIKFGRMYFAHEGMLYHNALTSNDSIDEHIQDNAVVLGKLGVDLSHLGFLDSVNLEAGASMGFDRLRSVYEMRKSPGFIANLHLGYRNFFINNSIYLGKAMNLPIGDSFYHRSRYNRLDLGWVPLKTKRLEGRLIATFHFSPGFIDNQQSFIIRYSFGKKLLN